MLAVILLVVVALGCSSDTSRRNDKMPMTPESPGPGSAGSPGSIDAGMATPGTDAGDACPGDPAKTEPGACGCGAPDFDSDTDEVSDCLDGCPDDAAKLAPGDCGCGRPDSDADATGIADCLETNGASPCGPVTAVPQEVRDRLGLDPFYEKYLDARGLPVLSSDEPDDQSLILACELLNGMLQDRDDVRQALIDSDARFAIIGVNEGTAEIPEYGYRDRPQSEIDAINQRARGLAGQVASCGEENILCLAGDRYWNESICVHEFSHTISTYGVYRTDRTFEGRLQSAFEHARDTGLYQNTYALENSQEYWAEGVQSWYDTNAQAFPPDGIHNEIDTRDELRDYDPMLYALIDEVFPESRDFADCH